VQQEKSKSKDSTPGVPIPDETIKNFGIKLDGKCILHYSSTNPHNNGDCRTLQKFFATSDITSFVKSISDIATNRAKFDPKRKRENSSGKEKEKPNKSQKPKKQKGEANKTREKGKPDPSVIDKIKVIETDLTEPSPDIFPTDIVLRPSTESKVVAMTISRSPELLGDLAKRMMEDGVIVSDSVRTSNKTENEGLLDSGASRCMSPRMEHFDLDKLRLVKNEFVYLADNYPIPIKGIGPIRIRTATGKEFWIEEGLWVPDLE